MITEGKNVMLCSLSCSWFQYIAFHLIVEATHVFNPYAAWCYIHPMHKNAKIFENHLNPVMLVLIWKLSRSTLRWVPICHGLSNFSAFSHHFVLAKLATSRIRVKHHFWDLPSVVLFVRFDCFSINTSRLIYIQYSLNVVRVTTQVLCIQEVWLIAIHA